TRRVSAPCFGTTRTYQRRLRGPTRRRGQPLASLPTEKMPLASGTILRLTRRKRLLLTSPMLKNEITQISHSGATRNIEICVYRSCGARRHGGVEPGLSLSRNQNRGELSHIRANDFCRV
ncbi:unnamed protein product, partial [Ectocarpus sp. 6 AP-2014]